MTQGDVIHGFRLMRKYPSGDFKGTLYAFEHEKSGAQVFWFSTKDAEAMGMIGVRTPVADDTGVAHVLEHMIGYETRGFRLSDADFNAFTTTMLTAYHFKCRSPKKLCASLGFWLDQMYHPQALGDPRLFAMEGWRYDAAPDGRLFYNGVVYNEMRAAAMSYGDPNIAKCLMPGAQACYNPGGEAEAIVRLRHEDVVAFHRAYYYPSNTAVCLYGDVDIEATLRFLDAAYFAKAERKNPPPFDAPFARPAHTLHHQVRCESLSPDADADGSRFWMLWMLGERELHPNRLEIAFLEKLLFGSATRMHGRMERAGFSPFFFSELKKVGRQEMLLLIEGSSRRHVPEKSARYERVFRSAMKTLRGHHFQQEEIVRALRVMKEKKENNRAAADAMTICQTVLEDFANGRNIAADFHQATDEQVLRMHLADGSLDRFIQTCLVATPPALLLTVTPSYELRQQHLAEEKEALARKQAQMTAEELEAIRTQGASLLEPAQPTLFSADPAMQETPRAPEEDDEPLLTVETIGGATLLHAAIADDELSGRCYFDMSFDASHLPTRAFGDLFFWNEALSHLPTVGTKGASFPQRFASVVQAYTPSSYAFRTRPDGSVQPVFTFHFTCAVAEVKKALGLIREMLTATSLADDHEVESRFFQAFWNCSKVWNPDRPESDFVIQQVADEITPYGAARHQLLSAAASQLSRNRLASARKLRPRLAAAAQELFCRDRAVVFFAVAENDVPVVREQCAKFLWQLPKAAPARHTFHVQMQARREGYGSDRPLQYIAAGGRLPYHGSLNVLASLLLTDYLLPRIRQAGGAYEVEIFPNNAGSLAFYSGRDPHLAETLDTFAQAADFVRTLDVSKEHLAAAIAGVLPPEEAPGGLESSLDALADWNQSRTKETYRNMVREARDTTIDELRAYAPAIEDLAQNGSLCVAGNEDVLRANADRFQSLQMEP